MKHSNIYHTARKVLIYTSFTIVAVIVLIPLYYLILASFTVHPPFTDGWLLFPDGIEGFSTMPGSNRSEGAYWHGTNSIQIAVLFAGGLFLTSMVGHSPCYIPIPGRTFIFILVLIVMMIPIEILMLPLYNLTVKWRIINTKAGVIPPFMVAGNAIFFPSVQTSLPVDLMDRSYWRGYRIWHILQDMLPLMRPFGAMTIFSWWVGTCLYGRL